MSRHGVRVALWILLCCPAVGACIAEPANYRCTIRYAIPPISFPRYRSPAWQACRYIRMPAPMPRAYEHPDFPGGPPCPPRTSCLL